MSARYAMAWVALGGLVVACGGGGASLRAQPYPGDSQVNHRRLEALARTFERTVVCTEEDEIVIQGMAPGVYAVEGCRAMRDYMLNCRYAARAYGYGSGQTCDWIALPDLSQRAAAEMGCGPDYLDIQAAGGMNRVVMGCGYRATYVLNCGGQACDWTLVGVVEPAGPAMNQGTGYTY